MTFALTQQGTFELLTVGISTWWQCCGFLFFLFRLLHAQRTMAS